MMYVSLAVAAVITIVFSVWVALRLGQRSPGIAWLLLALMNGMMLSSVVIAWVMARRTRSLPEQLAASDGHVCPRCLVPMRALALPGQDPDSDLGCPKCRMQWSRADLKEFWELMQSDQLAAGRWLMDRRAREADLGALPRLAFWVMRKRGDVPWIIGMNIVLWLGFGMAFAAMRGMSIVGGVFTYLHMAILMSGFMILSAGWKRRVGHEARCAKCGYIREPDSASRACPECGASWHLFGGIVRGEIQRRASVMAAGAVLMLAGGAMVFSPILARGWHFRLMPTGSLIRDVTRSGSFTIDEWAVLRTRTLSADQTLRLAEGLLDKRLQRSFLEPDADAWLVAQIAASKLPRPLIDRYYAEEMEFWILAPTRMKVGEQATIAMASRFRSTATLNPKSTVLFGGYFTGDEDARPHGRHDDGIPGIMFGEQRYHIGQRDSGPGTSPKAAITATTPRSITIRVELWVVHLPTGTMVRSIGWLPDGAPALPAGTVWTQHRSLEHVIEVTP